MSLTREPRQLSRGKAFHKLIQREWLATVKDGTPRPEKSIRRLNGRNGRMDILVEELGDIVSIVEIKATDWDRIKERNVRRNVRRHIRQIWGYVDAAIELLEKDVCPGVIFPRLPRSARRRDAIEELFNEEGIQVVWHDESIADLKRRMSAESA